MKTSLPPPPRRESERRPFHRSAEAFTPSFTSDRRFGAIGGLPAGAAAALALALLAVLLVAGSLSALLIARGLDNSSRLVEHTLGVKIEARSLKLVVAESESALRGFLLTGETAYLDRFAEAQSNVGPAKERLAALTADNPPQERRLAELSRNIDTEFDNFERLRGAAEAEGIAAARALLEASDGGLVLVREIDAGIDGIIAAEQNLLQAREAEAASQRQWLFGLLSALLLATIFVGAVAISIGRRELRAAATERERAAARTIELERRVRARTADLETAQLRSEAAAEQAKRERGRVEILLRDVNHRTGNNLSMVAALLAIQAAKIDDERAKEALDAARERVYMIGAAQRRLQVSDDLEKTRVAEFFRMVVNDIVDAWPDDAGIAVHHDYEDLIVEAKDAVALAVALGELVTNALKHAFGESGGGTVWTKFSRNADGACVLEVADDGIGFIDDSNSTGVGSTVIDGMAKQFGGEVSKSARSGGGARVRLTLRNLSVGEHTKEGRSGNSQSDEKLANIR